MAGQTISDRLLAARHSIAGQGLAKAVCKATTEEILGPKKKHLDYLIHCTNEPNVSIPQLANLLIERSQNANWVVVYKALITVHHMMCYGNERFTQYLASSNSTFQLSNFLDKSGVQGYDMSPFIRRYAKYLNEKALSYRTVAFDFCKVKQGKDEGVLRLMNGEKLLKTLPVLQSQLDALLEFDCSPNDLTNGVINMCFTLLLRDLIRLYACYSDGHIGLLEKYFSMYNKKQCRDGLDLYKKFLIRLDRVEEFMKVAENAGIDKGDMLDLTKAPSSLLDAMEQHYISLDGKKGSAANTPTQSASNRTNVKSGVSALSSSSSAFGTAASGTRVDEHGGQIDEALRRQVLAEEEAAMNQYKAKVSSPTTGPSTNPFLSSPTITSSVDLFAPVDVGSLQQQQSTKASDDLLQLSGNPFADMFGSAPAPAAAPATVPGANSWMSNGFAGGAAPAPMANNNAFAIFGDAETTSNGSVFDALGEVLQPAGGSSVAVSAAGGAAQSASGKVLTGDLDSSLASLAENLSMNKGAQQNVKGVQWNSPKNTAKAGGVAGGWTPQPMAATTGANYRPMGQGMASSMNFHMGMNMDMNMPTQFPAMQTMQAMPGMVPVQGMAGMAPQAAPGMAPMRPGVPAGVPAGVPMMGGGAGGGSMGPAQPGQPMQAQPQTMDPFGAL